MDLRSSRRELHLMIKGHRLAVAASLCARNICGVAGAAAKHAAAAADITKKLEQ
jgi:hypothetical protein